MAEVLIRAVNNPHSMPERGWVTYKIGDPIWVGDDSQEWGRSERLPNFYIIRFEGVLKAAMEYIKEQNEPTEGWGWVFDQPDPQGAALGARRCRWRCNLAEMERRSPDRADSIYKQGFLRRPHADIIAGVKDSR